MAGKLFTFQLEDVELEVFSPVKVPLFVFSGVTLSTLTPGSLVTATACLARGEATRPPAFGPVTA